MKNLSLPTFDIAQTLPKDTGAIRTKKTTKATSHLVKKPEGFDGGQRFTHKEVDLLLDVLEEYPPQNAGNWAYIASVYDLKQWDANITTQRDANALQRKFQSVRPIPLLLLPAAEILSQILHDNKRKPTGNATLPEQVKRAKKIDCSLNDLSGAGELADGMEPLLAPIDGSHPTPTVRAVKALNPPLRPAAANPGPSRQPKSKGEELISTVSTLANQIQERSTAPSFNATTRLLITQNQDLHSRLDRSQEEVRRLTRKLEQGAKESPLERDAEPTQT